MGEGMEFIVLRDRDQAIPGIVRESWDKKLWSFHKVLLNF